MSKLSNSNVVRALKDKTVLKAYQRELHTYGVDDTRKKLTQMDKHEAAKILEKHVEKSAREKMVRSLDTGKLFTETKINTENFGLGSNYKDQIRKAVHDKGVQEHLTRNMSKEQKKAFDGEVNSQREAMRGRLDDLRKEEGIKNLGNALGGKDATKWSGTTQSVKDGVQTTSSDATGNTFNPLNLSI